MTEVINQWLSLSVNTSGPRYIVDADGRPFHLFGMARCQYHQYDCEDPVYGGIEGLCTHFKKVGCNAVRLSVDTKRKIRPDEDLLDLCGGNTPQGIRRFIETYVDPDVKGILRCGMYVILDLHLYPPNETEASPDPARIVSYAREHYIPIWRELAQYYRDEPMIAMYELWNEPYAADQGTIPLGDDGFIRGGRYHDYNWNFAVRDFFLDCVNEIRKIDKRHMLLVSDYNAGWGCGLAVTWLGHAKEIDAQQRNTLFSIHAAADHLGPRIDFFDDWWAALCNEQNIALQFGEIETEGELMTESAMKNFMDMFHKRAHTHHYSGFLWRPHNDEENYTELWADFARGYTGQNA